MMGNGVLGEPWPYTASELQAIIHAERSEDPFIVYRDASAALHVTGLRSALTVGRNPSAGLIIDWDDQVSGLHAELEHLAGEFTLVDDGLSRNGSYVNGERVLGRRRLRNGDRLQFGRTIVVLHHPAQARRRPSTAVLRDSPVSVELSAQQRRVLFALCRPIRDGTAFAAPATNRQIADELHLSVPAVKLHLRALFVKFGGRDLPQNEKRRALVGRAFAAGRVADDLQGPEGR